MRILYSPIRSDESIKYLSFSDQKITFEYRGNTDEIDLSDVKDIKGIETSLEVNPIISAYRANGVLDVVLLNYIGPDATIEERFPDWIDV